MRDGVISQFLSTGDHWIYPLDDSLSDFCEVMFGLGELQIGFQDVAFLPSKASFTPHFLEIMVEVRAS